MANNEHINKVVKSTGETLIDLTSDTVTPSTLLQDVTAHDRSGAAIVGTAVIPTVNDGTLTIQQNGTTKATFTANQAGNVTANIAALATNATVTLNGAITGTSNFNNNVATINTKRKSCCAGNNSGTISAQPYYKVASLKGSLEAYKNYRLALYVQQTYGSNGAVFGILDIDIRTEVGPLVGSIDAKWLISASGINPEDFILVHDKTTGSIDIYCKCYGKWQLYRFVVLSESKVASVAEDSDTWTLYDDTTGIAELPTGDNIVIAYSSLADVNIDIDADNVTSMTGYSKPLSTSAITTTDTLNEAIGKLEKGLDGAAPPASSSTIDFVGEGISLSRVPRTTKVFEIRTYTTRNEFYFRSPSPTGVSSKIWFNVQPEAPYIDFEWEPSQSPKTRSVVLSGLNDTFFASFYKEGASNNGFIFKYNYDSVGDFIGKTNNGAALSGSTLDLWYETAKLNGKKILTDDDINSWRALQLKVSQDDMSDISVGDQYTCAKGAGTLTWDVIGKNIDTPADPNRTNALTLRVDECLPDNLQFDAPEALYACSEVMPAGTYHYTVGSTSYQFTTTRAYPIGGQFVCTNDATLYTYTSASSTSAQEVLTVTQGSGGTDLGTLSDNVVNGNLNTNYRRQIGSNDYKESAIRQWLNSDKSAGEWWTPQTPWDRPPAYAQTINGFMYDLDPEFLGVIGKTQVTTKYFHTSTGAIKGTYTTEDYFFLMSLSQVSSDYSNEGSKYTPYSDDASRIMYKNGSASSYWLRSSHQNASHLEFLINPGGGISNNYTNLSRGVVPACNII